MRGVAMLAGIGLVVAGCGGGSNDTTTSGTGAATANGGASGTGGAGTTTTGTGGTMGTGGASCGSDRPMTLHPWTTLDCTGEVVTTLGQPLEVARIPGWVDPILVHQVTIMASSNPLDGGCTLDAQHTLLVAVGADMSPSPSATWTEVSFNPHIPDDTQTTALTPVVVDIPPQLVGADENLFVAMKTQGDKGRFCFGACQGHDGWTWEGDDVGGLTAGSSQAELVADGTVQHGCEGLLHNNLVVCDSSDLSSLTAAGTEDGDLVIERLVAPGDISVDEIVLEMSEGASCVLPAAVELIYFVGDAAAPTGGAWTEVDVPIADSARIDDRTAAYGQKIDPPLLVPAGKALYAGIRAHPSTPCIATCAGAAAMPGDSWWGHTHFTPGEVVWASLASEGFLRSLRLSAVYQAK